MRYITITNEPDVAAIYERQGVTDVMIDLENEAKLHRQPEGAWISSHNLDDVSAVRPRLAQTRLIVRVESTEFREADQIDEAVGRGADAVMLPFFFKADEVGLFCEQVGSRAERILLVETPESARNLDTILSNNPIDYVHIGLNDMSIKLGLPFVFQALLAEEVSLAAKACREAGVPLGIGGVAKIGMFEPSPALIAVRHAELGSSGVILNRSFCRREPGLDWSRYEIQFSEALSELKQAFAAAKSLSSDHMGAALRDLREIIEEQARDKTTID